MDDNDAVIFPFPAALLKNFSQGLAQLDGMTVTLWVFHKFQNPKEFVAFVGNYLFIVIAVQLALFGSLL